MIRLKGSNAGLYEQSSQIVAMITQWTALGVMSLFIRREMIFKRFFERVRIDIAHKLHSLVPPGHQTPFVTGEPDEQTPFVTSEPDEVRNNHGPTVYVHRF
jgi:hypothetical protein